jgi:hypothetical protein
VVGLVFVVTALAYALVPVLEQKAIDAGNPPPPSAWRDALRADGWRWLLLELLVLSVVAIASMLWDRLRGLQNPAPSARMHRPGGGDPPSNPPCHPEKSSETRPEP